LQQYFTAVILS